MKKLFVISRVVGAVLLLNGLTYAEGREGKGYESQIEVSKEASTVLKKLAEEGKEIKGKKNNQINIPEVLKKLKSDSPQAHKDVNDAAQFIRKFGNAGFTLHMDVGNVVAIDPDPSAISVDSVYGKLEKLGDEDLKKGTLILTYNDEIRHQLEAIIGNTHVKKVVWDNLNSMVRVTVGKAGLRQLKEGIETQGIGGKIIFDGIEHEVSPDTITRVEALTSRKIGASEAFYSVAKYVARSNKGDLLRKN